VRVRLTTSEAPVEREAATPEEQVADASVPAPEHILVNEVLSILRDRGQPVPIVRLFSLLFRSATANEHILRIGKKRFKKAFQSFLETSVGLQDVELVSILS
jgi:hypothetical protein